MRWIEKNFHFNCDPKYYDKLKITFKLIEPLTVSNLFPLKVTIRGLCITEKLELCEYCHIVGVTP